MKKKIVAVLIMCYIIVLVIYFSGCIEERQPTTTEKSQYIGELRSIQLVVSRYSDDEYSTDYEGIDVAVIFIGEIGPIKFGGVPVNITAEVYGYSSSYDWYQSNLRNATLLYTKTVTVYGTSEDGRPPYVWIPFEVIPDLDKYYEEGAVKVTVETPKQGVYTDWDESVSLYTRKYK